jgi:DNA-binding response OmpR family regulator
MLTARGDTQDRVAGLDAGADDYLVKPFAMPELLARVRALLRRQAAPRAQRELRLGALLANLDTRQATTNEGRVQLTDTECALLRYFAENEGQLLTRAEILENAWGMDRFPTARTVDNYVLRLRKLFEPEPEEPRHFLTVRGTGYRFVRA